MNATNYYVWSEGEETGPMDHAEVIRRWVGGELPKGFLWRRADQSDYRPPGELYEERTREYTAPSRIPPAVPARPPHGSGVASQWFAAISSALGVLALIVAAIGRNGHDSIANAGMMTDRIVWAIIGLALVVIGVGTSIRGGIQQLIDTRQ